jgi:hypothetical protein
VRAARSGPAYQQPFVSLQRRPVDFKNVSPPDNDTRAVPIPVTWLRNHWQAPRRPTQLGRSMPDSAPRDAYGWETPRTRAAADSWILKVWFIHRARL